MGHKRSSSNFPKASRQGTRNDRGKRYYTPGYYQPNRSLGVSEPIIPPDLNESNFDQFRTEKKENFKGDGYYGSNYGNISEINRGRDYEWNAGYRNSYDRLPIGQWPEVESAALSRGRDPMHPERRQDGPHKGKGPRNYQRSDVRIKEGINDRLMDDPYIDATEIEVSVENGEVILTGMVENREIRRRAEDIAEQVSGIRHFENRLRVRFPGNPIVNIRNSK